MTDGKAIHSSIQYIVAPLLYVRNTIPIKSIGIKLLCLLHIEANPVRSGLVEKPEDWKWSSAYARVNESDLTPDNFNIPVIIS